MRQRNSKGRFMSKAELEAAKAAEIEIESQPQPEVEQVIEQEQAEPMASSSPFEINKKIELVLESPMKVFKNKKVEEVDKTSILAGHSVIVEKMPVIGPTGTNMFRVKRANCDRLYYTIAENVETSITK